MCVQTQSQGCQMEGWDQIIWQPTPTLQLPGKEEEFLPKPTEWLHVYGGKRKKPHTFIGKRQQSSVCKQRTNWSPSDFSVCNNLPGGSHVTLAKCSVPFKWVLCFFLFRLVRLSWYQLYWNSIFTPESWTIVFKIVSPQYRQPSVFLCLQFYLP